MAPDSVGDGDRSGGSYPRRRRRRLVKSGCRVFPSSPEQELSGSSKGRKEKVRKDDYALGYRKPRLIDGKLVVSSSSEEDNAERDSDNYYRKMTQAEVEIYNQQILETGGFDVDVPPEVDDCGIIRPDPDFDKYPRKFEEVKRCSRKANDLYNEKHNAKYEFMRVLKVGTMFVGGLVHYITFEAKAEGAAPVCFQAIVYSGCRDDIRVIMSRPKP